MSVPLIHSPHSKARQDYVKAFNENTWGILNPEVSAMLESRILFIRSSYVIFLTYSHANQFAGMKRVNATKSLCAVYMLCHVADT